MKVMRVLLVGLIALIACGAHVAPLQAPTLKDRRAEIIKRDIAFSHDSLPLLRFAPPPVYGMIRLAMEKCTGLTRDGWPTFYVANVEEFPGYVWAFYVEHSRSVVFALGREAQSSTVAHEIGHFLLAPHVDPRRGKDESHEAWVERTHPAAIYGPGGTCSALLNPAP